MCLLTDETSLEITQCPLTAKIGLEEIKYPLIVEVSFLHIPIIPYQELYLPLAPFRSLLMSLVSHLPFGLIVIVSMQTLPPL